jgi:hypothetical protein
MLNADWMAVLEQLVAMHGEEHTLRLAGKDRVACKMLNADWMEELTELVATHGEEHALWIMGNRQHYNRFTCLNLRRPLIILFLIISLENLWQQKNLIVGDFYGLLSPPGRYDRPVCVVKSPSRCRAKDK